MNIFDISKNPLGKPQCVYKVHRREAKLEPLATLCVKSDVSAQGTWVTAGSHEIPFPSSALVSTGQQESWGQGLLPVTVILWTKPELFWIRKWCSNSLFFAFYCFNHQPYEYLPKFFTFHRWTVPRENSHWIFKAEQNSLCGVLPRC